MANPFTAALVAGGALFGGISSRKAAKEQKAAIEDAIEVAEANLPFMLTQIRMNEAIQLEAVSRNMQRQVGTALVAISPASESAVRVASSQLAEAALTSFAVKEEAKRRRQVTNRTFVEQVTNLKNQIPSVGMATLQGALGGAQAGLQLAGAFSRLGTVPEVSAANQAAEQRQAAFLDQVQTAVDSSAAYLDAASFSATINQAILHSDFEKGFGAKPESFGELIF